VCIIQYAIPDEYTVIQSEQRWIFNERFVGNSQRIQTQTAMYLTSNFIAYESIRYKVNETQKTQNIPLVLSSSANLLYNTSAWDEKKNDNSARRFLV